MKTETLTKLALPLVRSTLVKYQKDIQKLRRQGSEDGPDGNIPTSKNRGNMDNEMKY